MRNVILAIVDSFDPNGPVSTKPDQRQFAALRALRVVNSQASVEELFAECYTGFDHAVAEQINAACEWINELHGRHAAAASDDPLRDVKAQP